MPEIATTPEPPYHAVIFTSLRPASAGDDGYQITASRMLELARLQPGFFGADAVRDGIGITVSYWQDEASIQAWRQHCEHTQARELGRSQWYQQFSVRVARVERAYSFCRSGCADS